MKLGITECEQCHTEFVWTIKKFSVVLEVLRISKNQLGSKIFSMKVDNEVIIWFMTLNFIHTATKEGVRIRLRGVNPGLKNCFGKMQLFFGKIRRFTADRKSQKISLGSGRWYYWYFIPTESIMDGRYDVKDDCITVVYRLSIFSAKIVNSGPTRTITTEPELFADYKTLFDNRECTDITFVIGETEEKAHRAILIARSPVFASMFDDENNRVNITNMTPEVFNKLLEFIYTNRIARIDGFVVDLLVAANEYKVQSLKKLCGEMLYCSLDVENAAFTLSLFADNDCEQLMLDSIKFINKHGLEVIDTFGYDDLEEDHPHLVTSLYKSLLIQCTEQKSKA